MSETHVPDPIKTIEEMYKEAKKNSRSEYNYIYMIDKSFDYLLEYAKSQKERIKELEEYEFMYKGLCK